MIRSEEVFLCQKVGKERYCFKAVLELGEVKRIQNLSKEETKTAEEARQGAIEVLQDALKKKDKVLMKLPEKVVLKGDEKDPFWMQRHAVLTEDLVKKLLAELRKVRFKKDIDNHDAYAYVYQNDETRTIYLCRAFWDAPQYLGRNSQPGTLIHEVSHFLGTHDLAYGTDVKPTLYVGCQGAMVKGNLSPARSSAASSAKESYRHALWKAHSNAENVEYEFELTLNHRGNYVGGKYSCCGETARYSVCDRSVPDFFHTCRVGKNWEIQQLHDRSKNIEGKLREHHKIVREIEKAKKAKASGQVGLSLNITGGAARATIEKEELDAIFAECQGFLDDVKRVTAFIKYKARFQRNFDIKYCSCLEYITVLKEEVESERDHVEKLHMYMKGIRECACLLESLCKITCE